MIAIVLLGMICTRKIMMDMLITRELKICSVFHLDLKLFSKVSAKIWNALFSKFDFNVQLYKF